jgi:hypothetical protein
VDKEVWQESRRAVSLMIDVLFKLELNNYEALLYKTWYLDRCVMDLYERRFG